MAHQKKVDSKSRKPFCVEKEGNVRVPVYQRQQVKNGRVYTTFTVAEYSNGKRLQHVLGNQGAAQDKARAIAKGITKGNPSLSFWSEREKLLVVEAMELVAEAASQAITLQDVAFCEMPARSSEDRTSCFWPVIFTLRAILRPA